MEVIGASGDLLTSLGNQAGGGAGSEGLRVIIPSFLFRKMSVIAEQEESKSTL